MRPLNCVVAVDVALEVALDVWVDVAVVDCVVIIQSRKSPPCDSSNNSFITCTVSEQLRFSFKNPDPVHSKLDTYICRVNWPTIALISVLALTQSSAICKIAYPCDILHCTFVGVPSHTLAISFSFAACLRHATIPATSTTNVSPTMDWQDSAAVSSTVVTVVVAVVVCDVDTVGASDGTSVGMSVGAFVGVLVGVSVGISVGMSVGISVGISVGVPVGV